MSNSVAKSDKERGNLFTRIVAGSGTMDVRSTGNYPCRNILRAIIYSIIIMDVGAPGITLVVSPTRPLEKKILCEELLLLLLELLVVPSASDSPTETSNESTEISAEQFAGHAQPNMHGDLATS